MSTPETGRTNLDELNRRLDAELGMVKVLEEMIRLRLPYEYVTHIIDPRQFSTATENVPVGLGIARKGTIARVTSIDDLNRCVIITPMLNREGKLGVEVRLLPQQSLSPELGACIDRLAIGVESLQKALDMFSQKK